jgi:2-keto-4-pentenoate hydratase/2-oxohepta-3-ene-1,7-dioic acid hydratase in catechol pathway
MGVASSSPIEVMGTGDVANVSDLRPMDDLWVGVEGVGRLKFSFPSPS